MNNALMFLGVALVLAIVGGAVVALVHRSRNVGPRTAADEFRQVMDALAPEPGSESHSERGQRPGGGVTRGT